MKIKYDLLEKNKSVAFIIPFMKQESYLQKIIDGGTFNP
jgi:hypothetical protein